jgi:hypothetical protein
VKVILPLCAFCAFYVLAFLGHAVLTEPKPIALKVRPLIAFAPTDVFLQVRVVPSGDDRWISVVMDSGEFSRRSDWTIEGDRPLYSFWWKDVPAGDYEIVARIGHGDTITASDRLTIKVQGM